MCTALEHKHLHMFVLYVSHAIRCGGVRANASDYLLK